MALDLRVQMISNRVRLLGIPVLWPWDLAHVAEVMTSQMPIPDWSPGPTTRRPGPNRATWLQISDCRIPPQLSTNWHH